MAIRLHFASIRQAVLGVSALLVIIASEANSTIVNITTVIDGNKLNLSTIEVTSGAGNSNRVFTYEQLIKPTIVDYLSVSENNTSNTVTVIGTPDTTAPDGPARSALISDAHLNTGIFNPSTVLPGLTIKFDPPLINGPGEDLVLFELTIGTGQTPDPVVLWKADGTGTPRNVTSGQYQKSDVIPIDATPVTYLVTVEEGQSATLNDLLNSPLAPSATSDPKWHAVPINLNALGVAEGNSVQSLAILSGDGTRAVDLLMVVGLPPYIASLDADYNGNHVVDAADYVVWRKFAGQNGAGLAADGSGPIGVPDGVVDDYDYHFWRTKFGNSSFGTGSAMFSVTVPEPPALLLGSLASVAIAMVGRNLPARCSG